MAAGHGPLEPLDIRKQLGHERLTDNAKCVRIVFSALDPTHKSRAELVACSENVGLSGLNLALRDAEIYPERNPL